MKRTVLLLSLLLFLGRLSFGQNQYAYFYIEGDQETPFYVKVEGQMQPRYGQNYFIIPHLDAGYTHFEILFQQNEYPPQLFLLNVPKEGFRGFALRKVNDRQFALYDLQQGKSIMAGNKKEDDRAVAGFGAALMKQPEEEALRDAPAKTPRSTSSPQSASPKVADEPIKKKDAPKDKKRRSLANKSSLRKGDTKFSLPDFIPVTKRTPPSSDTDKRDVFMEGVVLNGSGGDDRRMEQPEQQSLSSSETGCLEAMSNDAFESIALQLLEKGSDEDKLKFLKKEKEHYCFSTEQVRVMAKSLKGQAARYDAVRMLYPHTSDKAQYPKLEALFNTPYLKEQFARIMDAKE